MTITHTETTAQANRAPRLSIVTVVWNDPDGLASTFHSLKSLYEGQEKDQALFEHVIVDSSPEKHGEIFSELSAGYPLVRIASEKSGIYAAMNIGARAARGELLWFLNAGDTLTDAKSLRLALSLLEPASRSILCGPVIVNGPEGETLLQSPTFARGTFGKNTMCHQAIIYPRSLLREFSYFDQRYQIAADFQLHLRMLLSGVEMAKYSGAFARFELGGASSKIFPALREFSQIQRELNRGWMDAVARQLCLLKEGCLIAVSKVLKRFLGGRVHHRLKKLARERR